MKYTEANIDDYHSRLSDNDKKLLITHCNKWDIAPVICAWYDDMDDFYDDWSEVGYSKESAKELLNTENTQGEFKKFSDGRIVRLIK